MRTVPDDVCAAPTATTVTGPTGAVPPGLQLAAPVRAQEFPAAVIDHGPSLPCPPRGSRFFVPFFSIQSSHVSDTAATQLADLPILTSEKRRFSERAPKVQLVEKTD
jgi:hypothetical protein